jgi:hypothetical protein
MADIRMTSDTRSIVTGKLCENFHASQMQISLDYSICSCTPRSSISICLQYTMARQLGTASNPDTRFCSLFVSCSFRPWKSKVSDFGPAWWQTRACSYMLHCIVSVGISSPSNTAPLQHQYSTNTADVSQHSSQDSVHATQGCLLHTVG